MDICHLRSADNLIFSCILSSVADIVINTSGEQPCILQYEREQRSQIFPFHIPDINAVNLDGTTLHVVKAEQQIHQRCLSSSCRTDDRHRLAFLDIATDMCHEKFL